MDFRVTYTPEQEEFRSEVRRWLEANVPASIFEKPADEEGSYRIYLQRRELGRRLGERGWLYPMAPTEYGGAGLDIDRAIILSEEMDRIELSNPPYYDSGGRLGAPCILVWGTEEQKRTFLPPIFTGEVRTWQLLTEPGAGSDLAGVQTTAIRDGDDYVINGQKIFVGSSHGTDRIWMLAKTDPDGLRHRNVSWFMIDGNLPGITVQPMELLSGSGEGGADTGHKNTVFFDNVRVPAYSLVGGENNGWEVSTTHLELEHGGAGSISRNRMWDRLLQYCQETKRTGIPLSKDPEVRDVLAEIYIKVTTNRLLQMRNFWLTYTKRPRSYEGSQSSYIGKMSGLWMTQAILEALGPFALLSDEQWGAAEGAFERQQRGGITAVHPAGTADIQRVIMARRIGIGRQEVEAAGVVLV